MRSLRDLILNDLTEVAYLGSEFVASEESIRLMIEVFQNKKFLKKTELIHILNFETIIKRLLDEIDVSVSEHYQFFMEVGERDIKIQGEAGKIHYGAIDFYIRPGNKPLVFLADHHHSFIYEIFKSVATNLDLQFIVAGEEESPSNIKRIYQADRVHCPIFTLMHLINSAHDEELLPFLESFIDKQKSDLSIIHINWDELAPEYLVYAQSTSTIFSYVDAVKRREGRTDIPSRMLIKAQFDKFISENIVYKIVIDKETSSPIYKPVNYAIKYSAARVAGTLVTELENSLDLDDRKLLDICYSKKYPFLHKLLTSALEAPSDNENPLFELAFYNAHILEPFLANKINDPFSQILFNTDLLSLIRNRLIDPIVLFKKLTITSGKCRELNKDLSFHIKTNLNCLAFFVINPEFQELLTSNSLFDLLSLKGTNQFFKNTTLVQLLKTKQISIDMISKIHPYKLAKNFSSLPTDKEKLMSLNTLFDLGINFIEQDSPAIPSIIDITKVKTPPVSRKTSPTTSPRRPQLNSALLANSIYSHRQAELVKPPMLDDKKASVDDPNQKEILTLGAS